MSNPIDLDTKVEFQVSGMDRKVVLAPDIRIFNGNHKWSLRNVLAHNIHDPKVTAKLGARIRWKTDIGPLLVPPTVATPAPPPASPPPPPPANPDIPPATEGNQNPANSPDPNAPPPDENEDEDVEGTGDGSEVVREHVNEQKRRDDNLLLTPIKFPELSIKKATKVAAAATDVSKLVQVYTVMKAGTRGHDKLPILRARILELDPNNTYVIE